MEKWLDKFQNGGGKSFYDTLLQNNGPIVDNTAVPIQLPYNLNYDKTRVVNAPSRGLNKTQLKQVNKNLKVQNDLIKKQELQDYQNAKLFHDYYNPISTILGNTSTPVGTFKPTGREVANSFGIGIKDAFDIPGIGVANDFVNPLSLVSKGIISPWMQAPLQAQQSDSYLPYAGAALSTALTVPMLRPASIAAKTILNPANIYRGALKTGAYLNRGINTTKQFTSELKNPLIKNIKIKKPIIYEQQIDIPTFDKSINEAQKLKNADLQIKEIYENIKQGEGWKYPGINISKEMYEKALDNLENSVIYRGVSNAKVIPDKISLPYSHDPIFAKNPGGNAFYQFQGEGPIGENTIYTPDVNDYIHPYHPYTHRPPNLEAINFAKKDAMKDVTEYYKNYFNQPYDIPIEDFINLSKNKYGGQWLDEFQNGGGTLDLQQHKSVPSNDRLNYQKPITSPFLIDPFTGLPASHERADMLYNVPLSARPPLNITQGNWKPRPNTQQSFHDPYIKIIEDDPQSETNIGKRMRKDLITKKVPAGLTAAAAIMAAPLAAPIVSAAMNVPLAGVAGLTGSNILNAGFATHGLKSVLSGDVATPWKQAYKSGNGWDYANAVAENAMTATELAPLVGPGYKGALGAFNYLNKQSTPYILSNRFNKLIKNTDLSKLNNFTEQRLIPRLDLLDKSSIGVNSDINELYKNNPEKYNELINQLFNENKDLYLRPIIRFKNTQPHSYIENLTLPSKNETLFKEKMCPPESECAKTANSVNNYLFKEITGKPFDYNANAHNAWHMEDQMIKHGGKNVTPNVIIGDRLLMGNGVDQSTYVPGMIADPNIRHAGVYAGDILHNGSRFPMVMESGKNSPLYLNPINYTFTGENTVLKAIRPSQHNNSDYLKSLVEKNMRYAYRNKPSIYNSFSFNKDAQNIISKINTHRDEIKNTYDLTNDEFDALRNSLIGIGAQETKLGATLPGSIAAKAKIQLKDILVNTGLSAPIKQVKGNVGKVLNKLNQSSELLSYPGSAYIEKEAAILSQNSNRSFEESLAIVKNKYQPKPKFSENTTSPSKGIFRQKFQTDLDKLADVNSNDEMRNAMGQMALNYQKAKKLYPEASPSQLVDITTLMWNSPGKAVNKELTDFYLFGNKNPNPLKFKFDYIDKVNKYKNKLIENPINKHGLEKHFEIFNEEGPEIYYKNGGPIVTNREQWLDEFQNGGVPFGELGQAYVKAYNDYTNRTFPKETLDARQQAYNTIAPSDYTDLKNYMRWQTNTSRSAKSDPRSEEAWKYYLGLSGVTDLKYLRKSDYKPTINATEQNYYSIDHGLEQDIFNAFKNKVELNKTLPVNEAQFSTPISGKKASALLGRFAVSKGHDEKGDYLSYYDKYDLKDFAQNRAKGAPYSIYGRVYYPTVKKKKEGGSMIEGAVTNTGYKNDSKDRYNDYNIIPSNNITMKNVSHPVLGVDNTGYTQMMQPGMDYTFPGQYVTEFPVMKNGGYVVRRSHDRKGKTHVVIGPDGTKKYFGDPNLGERSKSKYGKEAFYARHKHNLEGNPYFRAYARATWEEGGETMINPVVKNDTRNWLEYLND